MNTVLKNNSAASAAQSVQFVLGGVYARLANLAQRIRTAAWQEDETTLAIEQLSAMNDRQLRDIGLIRSDIEPAVRGLHNGNQ